jgi:hypothetical protein
VYHCLVSGAKYQLPLVILRAFFNSTPMKILVFSASILNQKLVDKINKIAQKSNIEACFLVGDVQIEPFVGLTTPIYYNAASYVDIENMHQLPPILKINGLTVATGNGESSSPVDLLLTTPWPSRITQYSPLGKVIKNEGSDVVSKLVQTLEPQYHFASSKDTFYEREPYNNINSSHCTRFIALADFHDAGKAKWFYAMNLNPLAMSDPAKPVNATKSPFLAPKITNDTNQNFFFGGDAPKPAAKRQKTVKGQEDMVCRACGHKGHSARMCSDAPRQNVNALRLKKRDGILV